MKILKLFYLALLILSMQTTAIAQKSITLSGYLKDGVSGESLTGAVVSIVGIAAKAPANSYGFYSLSIRPGTYKVWFSYVGYERMEMNLTLKRDTSLNINLMPASNVMDEVIISSVSKRDNVSRPVNVAPLSMVEVKQLPAFLGEADLIRSFQLLPGVSTVGDGASGFNVRGGGVDQNLVLLDEAPLYFTSHLFNLFSVANPDAIKEASLYKTEMPARFGGRLSSVLDTRMKDGNNKEWNFAGGLGLIASRFTAEGPLKKDKSSMIVSARRSYTDVLTKQSSDPSIRDNSIYFYDLSAKLNFALSDNDRLFVSGYFGKDKIEAANRFLLQWANGTGTVRWNHIYSPRLFSNTSLIYSDYKYRLGAMENPATSFNWDASIVDYTLKNAYSWYQNSKSTVYFGIEASLHDFRPGKATPQSDNSIFNTIEMPGNRAAEYSLYWDHELEISNVFSVEYGLRYTAFQNLAKGTTLVSDYEGVTGERKLPVNQKVFDDWATIKWYQNLQPRLSMKIKTGEDASIKASYSRTSQNLHLISNTISSSPLDIWTPSSYNVKPETADQVSTGYFRNFFNDKYEASAEVYYRKLNNQIDFIDGAETLLNEDLPGDMLFGKGRAYGSEFYLKKNSGRLNGWVSYTFSKTERQIEGINNAAFYPAKYDKTHALSVVAVYQLKPRILLSGTYSYATGVPTTLPDGRFEFDGLPVQYNSGNFRNNYRIPDYHRLDVSATFKKKVIPGRKFTSEWVVSLFNALNRKNAFSVYPRQVEDRPADLETIRFSMFGSVIPSVTWNFKF
ncbi:TonB-dependent receptor [Arcticibacter eurypsychrophilus]|uniref:TonB-dependent receptor n=1 Tax=Arcticibacter eurypsychrophilus TaxID=1434752 RepID=UPI00084CEDBE|nr:TonB-dependent receptor [Arcticibacter eurypsychrophilus]